MFENKSGSGTLDDTMLLSSSNCKHEPSPATGDNFTHHKLLRNSNLCTSLRTGGVFCSGSHTEAGERNIYLLHSGARLEAGTVLPKTINKVVPPLTEISRTRFLSDRLLLNI